MKNTRFFSSSHLTFLWRTGAGRVFLTCEKHPLNLCIRNVHLNISSLFFFKICETSNELSKGNVITEHRAINLFKICELSNEWTQGNVFPHSALTFGCGCKNRNRFERTEMRQFVINIIPSKHMEPTCSQILRNRIFSDVFMILRISNGYFNHFKRLFQSGTHIGGILTSLINELSKGNVITGGGGGG